MSPKFKFKFDTVLKHRKLLEDKEAKEFYKRHSKLDKETATLNDLLNRYKDSQTELARKKEQGIDIAELKIYYTYMNALKLDIRAQRIKVKQADAKKEEQRKELVKAQKNKKVIDKLKENKINEFKEEERTQDLKTLDDINSGIEARKRKS